MLRTSAPLIGALYVGGLDVREGWLTYAVESPGRAAVFYHLFARILSAGTAFDGEILANEIESAVAVSRHAKLWKPKLTQVSGLVEFSAGPTSWFTRAGSIGGTSHQRPTGKQLSYCVQSLSESARS